MGKWKYSIYIYKRLNSILPYDVEGNKRLLKSDLPLDDVTVVVVEVVRGLRGGMMIRSRMILK